MVNDSYFLELNINHLIETSICSLFPPGEESHNICRETLYCILKDVVRKSLDLYREDFAKGMLKTLATARLRAVVDTAKEED